MRFLLFFLLSISAMADSKLRFYCAQKIYGPDIDGTYTSEAYFASIIPYLKQNIIVENTGKAPYTLRKTYLDEGNVCGIEMDFCKACEFQEGSTSGIPWFRFSCQGGMVGEVSLNGRVAKFTCKGPTVPLEYVKGIYFHDCRTSG